MGVYLQVRHAHFDEGRGKRSIAHDFGLARRSVDKECAFAGQPLNVFDDLLAISVR